MHTRVGVLTCVGVSLLHSPILAPKCAQMLVRAYIVCLCFLSAPCPFRLRVHACVLASMCVVLQWSVRLCMKRACSFQSIKRPRKHTPASHILTCMQLHSGLRSVVDERRGLQHGLRLRKPERWDLHPVDGRCVTLHLSWHTLYVQRRVLIVYTRILCPLHRESVEQLLSHSTFLVA